MQAPHKLETLDDLLAQAANYAEFCMRNGGKMAPAMFLIGDGKPLMFVPASLDNESEKDAFANMARLLCVAHDARAVVMALEAWMTVAKPGEKLDLTERPCVANFSGLDALLERIKQDLVDGVKTGDRQFTVLKASVTNLMRASLAAAPNVAEHKELLQLATIFRELAPVETAMWFAAELAELQQQVKPSPVRSTSRACPGAEADADSDKMEL